VRLLLSYWYYRDADLDEFARRCSIDGVAPDMWADSGAYSAMTRDAVITVDEYAAWLHKWDHLFSAACNLDVIGNAKGTMENQHALERLGCAVLPVYHMRDEDPRVLKKIAASYPYGCLGGMAGTGVPPSVCMRWMVDTMMRVKGSEIVWHGLGATSNAVLGGLPLYSVDSSSWLAGRRWGYYSLFDSTTGRSEQVHIGDHEGLARNGRLLRRLGFEPRELFSADPKGGPPWPVRDALGIATYSEVEAWCQRRHGPVLRADRPDEEPGLRMYAVTGPGVKTDEVVQMLAERRAA
jgi:hypothetical protein